MLDSLNVLAGTVVATFLLMICIQKYNRTQLMKIDQTLHQNHLCTKLYKENLLSAMEIKTINVELEKIKGMKQNSMFDLYHKNMVNVQWDRQQLENMASNIHTLITEIKQDDKDVDFIKAYTKILLDELREDQLDTWSSKDKTYVNILKKNII